MRQVLQHLGSGETSVVEAPVPTVGPGQIIVETRASVVSAGTERMLVEFGRASLLQKARSQPDKVRQVLDKVRTDGLVPTVEAVRTKLDQPIPMGYCQSGVVVEAGADASPFVPGDRVVTNGSHAEYVRVPKLLAARIPDGVPFEHAAFAPVAAVGLQGIRLAQPTIGETVVVYGLGLIGLLAVQILRASGCRVIGVDRDPTRLGFAQSFGASIVDGNQGDVALQILARTGGVGADAILLTLASKADEPIHVAAEMARKRGRLVLVGVTGLSLRRDLFYKKELSFQVSCSYGPGRYDTTYEEGGQDYPLPFVRWTEQRNFEAVLGLMSEGQLDPEDLISHRFDIKDASDAYALICGSEPSLGVLLEYQDRCGEPPTVASRLISSGLPHRQATGHPSAAVIGAGNFASRILIPTIKSAGFRLRSITTGSGTSGVIAGRKFGFEHMTTDLDRVFDDAEADTVFVLTRHDSHARLVLRALEAGKNVFVEKPLALTEADLDQVQEAASRGPGILMVGFNRRFAPLTRELRLLLGGRAGPLSLVATINAGAIPLNHWTQDAKIGGGRIVGEACHFLDLARSLVGAPITRIEVVSARDAAGKPVDDIAHLTVGFADGSSAAVNYLANGARSYPKERIECHVDSRTAVIDNWRRLKRFGWPGRDWPWARGMDKGHAEELNAWFHAVRDGGPAPIPLDELIEVSRWAIKAAAQARHR